MKALPDIIPAGQETAATDRFLAIREMRYTLDVAGFVLVAVALTAFQFFVLTEQHRQLVERAIEAVRSPGGELVSVVSIALLVTFLGIHAFRFHEDVYDHYLVRWRDRHDADFVLAKLFLPFAHRMKGDYQSTLRQFSSTLIDRVFCPFLQTNGESIEPRLIFQFYRALTRYWITQITELVCVFWLLAVAAYGTLGVVEATIPPAEHGKLFLIIVSSVVITGINAMFCVRPARRSVRSAAAAEIQSIMLHYPERLEALVLKAAEKYEMLQTSTKLGTTAAEVPAPGRTSGVPGLWDHAFVASPMASLPPAEYEEDRELVLQFVAQLRQIGFRQVFYAGEKIPTQKEFSDPFIALTSDLRQIRRSGAFIFHWPARAVSSALFELGYALALGKRVLILLRDVAHLPYLLKEIAQLSEVSLCTYRDRADLLTIIEDHREDLFGPQLMEGGEA